MDRNVRAFLAVARTGNLTLAADQIGLTQPALTKTIQRIEEDYDAILFEITSRGMNLTPAGEMLLERMRLMELHERQAREEIRSLQEGALAEFRVAAGSSYHLLFAPELVRQLSAEFPQTRFVLDFRSARDALPRLQQGELDMVLGAVAHTPSEGILVKRLLDVEVTAYCCRSNSLARRREALTAAELVPRRWVINRSDTQIVERLNHFFSDQLLAEPEVAMEIDSLIAGFMVVSGTELLVPAPTIVRTFAEAQGLVMLQLVEPLWKFRSGAWFPKSLERYAVLRRSLEILEDLISAIPSGYGVTQK